METKQIPSKRRFIVTFIEGEVVNTFYIKLNALLDDSDGMEWKYAAQDHFDEILNLHVGGRLFINFNRDNSDSGGIIKRVG